MYRAEQATRVEVEQWATETKETESYIIAYQDPRDAENVIDTGDEFNTENPELLTVWEKSDRGGLRNRQSMGGQKPEYKKRFKQITSDGDAEALF